MKKQVKVDLSSYEGKKGCLIPILQKIQEEFGYLPEDEIINVSKFTGIPKSNIFGVASFYAQFRFTPQGKNRIMVCRGTACHVKGAPLILAEIENQLNIKEGQTTQDMEYTLETVACIGCCALAPCITINNKDVYGRLTTSKVKEMFSIQKKEG